MTNCNYCSSQEADGQLSAGNRLPRPITVEDLLATVGNGKLFDLTVREEGHPQSPPILSLCDASLLVEVNA